MTLEETPGSIHDDELLWRRVHPNHLVDDGDGGVRVSTAEFRNYEMSVDRAGIVTESGQSHHFTRQDGAAVAEFSADQARKLDQAVEAAPLQANEAHANVIGDKPKPVQRAFTKLVQLKY